MKIPTTTLLSIGAAAAIAGLIVRGLAPATPVRPPPISVPPPPIEALAPIAESQAVKTDRIEPSASHEVRVVPITPPGPSVTGITSTFGRALAGQPTPAPAAAPAEPPAIVDAPSPKPQAEDAPPRAAHHHRRHDDDDDDDDKRDICQRHHGRKIVTHGGRSWHCVYGSNDERPRPPIQPPARTAAAPPADPQTGASPLVQYFQRMWSPAAQ